MELIKYHEKNSWKDLLKRPAMSFKELETTVNGILHEVKENGDKALYNFAQQFDKVNLSSLVVSKEEIANAGNYITDELKKAILQAKNNIELFHASQKEESPIVETVEGVSCWRKSIGIEKVGLYIPGGSAPLFSTVLMLGVPATLAGCKEIILCTPGDKNGEVHPAILYSAALVGISTIFKIGGAQAIAAMAYGTQSVPQVYKIFGPGNQYVTCAKQLVNKLGVAIDMPAGPSEVAILADDTCIPEFFAADLLSQAEHGPDSQVVLVSDSEQMIEKVVKELQNQLNALSRRSIAELALRNSRSVLVKDLKEGLRLLNYYAPEHLIIASDHYKTLMNDVTNAGSVFLGHYSCESAGDYASGTNHTLPTNGYAKAYSGVSLDSFVKKITFQKLTKQGLQNIGKTIELMAEAEGLDAHKNAVSIRLK